MEGKEKKITKTSPSRAEERCWTLKINERSFPCFPVISYYTLSSPFYNIIFDLLAFAGFISSFICYLLHFTFYLLHFNLKISHLPFTLVTEPLSH